MQSFNHNLHSPHYVKSFSFKTTIINIQSTLHPPPPGAWDPESASLDEVFRSQVVVLEHVVRLPVTQLRGVAAVVDCAGLSMNHAYHLTPAHIRRMISVIQVCVCECVCVCVCVCVYTFI